MFFHSVGSYAGSYAEGGAKAHSQFGENSNFVGCNGDFSTRFRLVEMTGGGLFGCGCMGIRLVLLVRSKDPHVASLLRMTTWGEWGLF